MFQLSTDARLVNLRQIYVSIVHLAERLTVNQEVVGAAPTGDAIRAHSSVGEQQTFNLCVVRSTRTGRTNKSI